MGQMERSTLYDDGSHRLDVELRSSDRRIAVFFPHRGGAMPWTAKAPLPQTYGADFAARFGLNAAIVGLAEPNWYQADSIPRFLSALQRMCGCFSHVTFVGSVMGGYGAIAAASAIAADHVIAFSPVSDISPKGPIPEIRHAEDFARLGPLKPIKHHGAARYTVIYDPADRDRRHLDAFDLPQNRVQRIGLIGAGASTHRVLKEAGMLSRFLRQSLSGSLPGPELRFGLNDAKRETPTWLFNMFGTHVQRRPEMAAWALDRLKETGVWAHRYPRMEHRLQKALHSRTLAAA